LLFGEKNTDKKIERGKCDKKKKEEERKYGNGKCNGKRQYKLNREK
jgi:hypothetical protein